MRVTSSLVSLSSAHTQSSKRTESLSVRQWKDEGAARVELSTRAEGLNARRGAHVANAAAARELPPASPTPSDAQAKCDDTDAAEAVDQFLDRPEGAQLMLLKALLERTTGRRFKLASDADYELSAEQQQRISELSDAAGQASSAPSAAAAAPERVGWGLEVSYEQRLERHERTSVAAAGTVRTADGREIRFDTRFSYARDEVFVERFELRAGDAKLKDPLVLNFDGSTPELGQSLNFDLNADGQAERVAMPSNNARLLVIDRDGNGQVNDGRELFGALSGSGFDDLAALDEDGNGFIDEGDSAYQHLYTWEGRDAGGDRLVSLAERGVGALGVSRVASPFELRSADGELQGRIRETGIFINEDGTVRALQQIDVKVEPLSD